MSEATMTILERLKAAIQEHYEKGGKPIVAIRCGRTAYKEFRETFVELSDLGEAANTVDEVGWSEHNGLAADGFRLIEKRPKAAPESFCPTCGQRRLVSP